MSEDCLYLNIFTPAEPPNEPLPVMVWIHGGGFIVGCADTYDATELAKQGVVVVAVNYRLGVFGFFAHGQPEMGEHGTTGNYGLMDILAALRWVSRNIQSFGGDPENVTVFGQSSGGTAVCYLLATPRSEGLLHKCISQSSGAYDLLPARDVVEQQGAAVIEALGVSSETDPLAAARQCSWQQILEATTKAGVRFGPSLDGEVFSEQPIDIFSQGRQHRLPLLIGSNTKESLEEFTMAAWFFAREQSRVVEDVYRYVFSMPSKDPRFQGRGAVHAAEIPYVFGGDSKASAHWLDSDRRLSEAMISMWLQFARTGNPNLPEATSQWPNYHNASEPYLELGEKIQTGGGWQSAECKRLEEAFLTHR